MFIRHQGVPIVPQSCFSSIFRLPSFPLVILASLLFVPTFTSANETDQDMPVSAVGGAVHADLFTGTATTSIPIAVPPGRGGVHPNLALVYNSANGNDWVGLGWKLEKSVIKRQTRFGLNYSSDDHICRLAGINDWKQPIPGQSGRRLHPRAEVVRVSVQAAIIVMG